jgi:redox-sensitive bicupin YhaK (pirin superfamily)
MTDTQISIRLAHERGNAEFGWLSSRHSFSFGSYYDPEHMGFRRLRVINDDRVMPGQGFGTHPHRDMEIISIVVEGALEHRDSLGNGSVIRPGDVQRMSAGTGVTHSEFNPSSADEVRFLQIWIEPETRGLEPSYEQQRFDVELDRNRWVLVGSRSGRDGSVTIHQDVELYRAVLDRGGEIVQSVPPDRHLWVQVISGEVELDGRTLGEGDGASLSGADRVSVTGLDETSDLLLFDLS